MVTGGNADRQSLRRRVATNPLSTTPKVRRAAARSAPSPRSASASVRGPSRAAPGALQSRGRDANRDAATLAVVALLPTRAMASLGRPRHEQKGSVSRSRHRARSRAGPCALCSVVQAFHREKRAIPKWNRAALWRLRFAARAWTSVTSRTNPEPSQASSYPPDEASHTSRPAPHSAVRSGRSSATPKAVPAPDRLVTINPSSNDARAESDRLALTFAGAGALAIEAPTLFRERVEFPDANGAVLVGWLSRVGVERRKGQPVGGGIVHRHEHLARTDHVRHVNARAKFAAA